MSRLYLSGRKKLTQVKIKVKKAELIYYVLASFREKPEFDGMICVVSMRLDHKATTSLTQRLFVCHAVYHVIFEKVNVLCFPRKTG